MDAHLAEWKLMLRIPLGRERVASDSLSYMSKIPTRRIQYSIGDFFALK